MYQNTADSILNIEYCLKLLKMWCWTYILLNDQRNIKISLLKIKTLMKDIVKYVL